MKKFSQLARVMSGKDLSIEERLLEVSVTSSHEGKFITIRDKVRNVAVSMNADLISFWLEHGTE